MNILFVGKRELNEGSGIEKKMMGQIRAFERLGHQVYYTFFQSGYLCLTGKKQDVKKILPYQDTTAGKYLAIEKGVVRILEEQKDFFQVFYIRKGLTSYFHLQTLKALKKQNIMIIEEIPTYPYDKELLKTPGVGLKLYYVIDKLSRGKLKKYVDYIVTYSEDKEILGIPTICINNGIDLNSIPTISEEKNKNTIHFVTVSAMYYWHGYERLINGLAKYYQSEHHDREIHIDMIGDGPSKKEWEQLTEKLGLTDKVTFWGERSGQELDDIFYHSDIAVSSLGLYKKNLQKASELKVREYCARGIPFILGCKDLGIKAEEKFYYKVENNDCAIDIHGVLQFLDSIKDRKQCIQTMREYAKQNFEWTTQMKKVTEKFPVAF